MKRSVMAAGVVLLTLAGCLGSPAYERQPPASFFPPPSPALAAPDMQATYLVNGSMIAPAQFTVLYDLKDGVLTATVEGEVRLRLEVDAASGLATAGQGNPLSVPLQTGDPTFNGSTLRMVKAGVGNPILGSSHLGGASHFGLNPMPPPAWLDEALARSVLGIDVPLSRSQDLITLAGCPRCNAIEQPIIETWTTDHGMFPAKRTIATHWTVEFHRLTPLAQLQAWPVGTVPVALPEVPPSVHAWQGIPPLGTGPLASDLGEFLRAVDEQAQEWSWDDNRSRVTGLQLSRTPFWYEVGGVRIDAPGVNLTYAYAGVAWGASEAGYSGQRRSTALGGEWQVGTARGKAAQLNASSLRPPLVALSDVLAAYAWGGEPFAAIVDYDILGTAPAQAARVMFRHCVDGREEDVTASLVTGVALAIDKRASTCS